MARAPKRRLWTRLKESTRRDYLRRGKAQGLTEQQIIALYESGGNVSALRGHKRRMGISERQWTNLRKAALKAQLDKDLESGDVNEVLESLLMKGFKYEWILRNLETKEDSRSEYRSFIRRAMRRNHMDDGWEPGRTRYHNRNQMADIELYYYH